MSIFVSSGVFFITLISFINQNFLEINPSRQVAQQLHIEYEKRTFTMTYVMLVHV